MVGLINAWELFSMNNKSFEEHYFLTTTAHYPKCYYNKTWTILFLYAYSVSWKKNKKTMFARPVKWHLLWKASSLSSLWHLIMCPRWEYSVVFNKQKWHPFKFKLLNLLRSLPGIHTKNIDLLALYRISNSFAYESQVNKSFLITQRSWVD